MANVTTTLLDLPTELHLQIIGYLDYTSSIALSYTNQRFKSIVSVEPPKTVEQKLAILCTIESWPESVLPNRTKSCYSQLSINQSSS